MFSDRLEKITNCLLQCEEDHSANIHRLTALCGEELGAACALYNRLEGDLLCSLGQWQTPQDYKASDSPEGHICYDVIKGDCNDAVLIRDLPSTHYAETDPNVRAYSLQTYLGHAVISEGKAVGSLCVVYQTDYVPAEDDKRFLKFIASAIGHEDTRWKSKEALSLSVSLLKATLEATADGILVVDTKGRIVDFNERFAGMWQLPDDVLAAKDDQVAQEYVLVQLKDPQGFIDGVKALYAQPLANSLDTIEFKDGRVFERLSCPQRLDNKVIGRVWSFRDVTDRKQAEADLVEEKAFTENALNILQDVFFVFDLQGRFLRWNKAISEITNYSDEEISLMKPTDFFLEEDHERVQKAIQTVIEEGSALLAASVVTKDGRILPYEYTASLLRNLEGEPVGISGVGRNVSERKKLEEQLLQAQKMEAVGQLAGGIAHDFNNILSAIMGYGSLLQMQMGKDFPFKKYVDEIMKSAERAAQLTASLLAFSRKQHIILKPIDLNDLVRDIHKLLSRIIGEDIELELKLSDYPLIIMADKVQIEHAIINIATNARDAMPDGGRMTIMARRHRNGEDFTNIHGSGTRGDYALLSIADTGTGLDDASKEKIFEPFFTTKEVGKGTGLGLSMVYGTIKQHGGYIDVESFPGEGTAFNIYLPLSESRKEIYQQEPPVPQSSRNASETILLVEDEGAVRQIMREILEQTGYRVIEAIDGEHALRELQQHRDAIHLLITDIIMPKMDGLTLCQKARAIKPGLKSIFISGYHDKILDSKGGDGQEKNYLSKPFTAGQFLKMVRETCDN